jgi:predicted SAM-dependent methyltransferase
MNTELKVIIGGSAELPGWKSLNIDPSLKPDYLTDITNLDCFADNSVSVFYMSHVFEHIKQTDINNTLQSLYKKLITGGTMYISVPDISVLAVLINSEHLNIDQKVHVMRMIYGGQTNNFDFHYFGYTFQIMEALLKINNFKNIVKVDNFELFQDTSNFKPYFNIPISLNVVCNR